MMVTNWVPRLSRQARRLGWPGVACVALFLAALATVAFAVPRHRQGVDALREQADRARTDALRAARLARSAAPDTDPAERFRAAFPAADSRNGRVAALLALASSHGLTGTQSEYRFQAEPVLGVARYRVSLPLAGPYPALRSFLAEALRSDPALALDSVRLRRPDPLAATWQAELQFSLMMRADPAKPAPPAVLADLSR